LVLETDITVTLELIAVTVKVIVSGEAAEDGGFAV
jgi:hypothetical protein